MQVKVEKLDHSGRGISFIDEKIVFIENALPEEIVEIEITNKKKKFCEAKVLNYIKKSDKRKCPECKYSNKCGGCDILFMSYKDQLVFKKNKVEEILKKFANIEMNIDVTPSDKILNYRDKITLKVKDNKIGYYRKKTNEIIEIDECLLCDNIINDKLKLIKKIDNMKSCYEIVIRNINSDKTAITFYLRNNDETLNFNDKTSIIEYRYRNNNVINKESKIIANISNFKFLVSPEAFFQINVNQTLNLYNKIKNYCRDENKTLLDLYCGTGTIGMYVANEFDNVYGIEICKPAIEDANKNKELNKIKNINFICMDTEKAIKTIDEKFDTIIVDPPRAGLNENIISSINRIKPNKIIYVSCDPVTFARDIKILKITYNIEEIKCFDMFPNTSHIETICLLTKINK